VQGSEIIKHVVFHRSSSAEDDPKKINQKSFFFQKKNKKMFTCESSSIPMIVTYWLSDEPFRAEAIFNINIIVRASQKSQEIQSIKIKKKLTKISEYLVKNTYVCRWYWRHRNFCYTTGNLVPSTCFFIYRCIFIT